MWPIRLTQVTDVVNVYFDSVTDLLDLFSWSTQTDNKNTDALQNILKRFQPKFNQNQATC